MKTHYGNSFSSGRETVVDLSQVSLWVKADEFYPCGAWLSASESVPAGTKIPAGTPVGVSKVGGTVTTGAAATAPVGLTYEDAYMGSEGCSLTIVTKGIINESLSEATVSDTQKGKLFGITFVKEG